MAQLCDIRLNPEESSSLQRVDSSETVKDEVSLSLEEVIKISHHRTFSSGSTDTLGEQEVDGSQQCCLCARRTLDRCPHCKWAAYCSQQCFELHHPVHRFFCDMNYAQTYPRLTGLTVTPTLRAALDAVALQKGKPGDSAATRGDPALGEVEGLPPDTGASEEPDVFRLIHRRSEIVEQNSKQACGKPACAICGDLCKGARSSTPTTPTECIGASGGGCAGAGAGAGSGEMSEITEAGNTIRQGASSGDTEGRSGGVVEAPNRLIRFAGLLLCMVCVEIQATKVV